MRTYHAIEEDLLDMEKAYAGRYQHQNRIICGWSVNLGANTRGKFFVGCSHQFQTRLETADFLYDHQHDATPLDRTT